MRATIAVLSVVIVFLAACNDSGQPSLPTLKPSSGAAEPGAATALAGDQKLAERPPTPKPKNELAPTPRRPRYRSHWPIRTRGEDNSASSHSALISMAASAMTTAVVTPDLLQGMDDEPITITGTGFTSINSITPSSGVTLSNVTLVNSTTIIADADVDMLAEVGTQSWMLDMSGGTEAAVAFIVPPTDVLPVTDDTEPSRNPAVAGVNVFLHNGEFFTSATDLATRGRMMGINWSRFYSSNNVYNGPLGHGWMGYYFQRAIFDSGPDDIVWYAPNGRTEVFAKNGAVWDAPAGVYIQASHNSGNGEVTLVDRHGFTCVFNADGRLESCTDRNGNSTTCTYNVAGQLETVTDDRGMEYEISYYDHGRVESVTDKVWSAGSPRVIDYEYNADGELESFLAPETSRYNAGNSNRTEYQYTYDAAHRMLTCKSPREVTASGDPYLTNTYDSTGRVIQQQLGTSGQNIYLRYHSSTVVREVDRRELRTDYTIDASGRATGVQRFNHYWSVDTTDPIDHTTITKTSSNDVRGESSTLSWSTSLTYNANNEVTSVTYPATNFVTYAYPSIGSETSGVADSCANQTLTRTSSGWTTNAFAGMTLRMGSDASDWRDYPIVSNTSDTIVVAAAHDLDADGWNDDPFVVFDHEAESPNPLARGNVLTVTRDVGSISVGSQSDIVSSYTYEPRFQFVKTSTDPRGNVSTYKYDYEATSPATTAGNLIETKSEEVTAYLPNFTGTTNYHVVNAMAYNGYGQVTSTTDAEGNVTAFSYYSGGDKDGFLYQRIVNPGGGNLNLTTEFDYNRAGLTIAMWPPRAFDGGVTKDDFKTSYTVNELNQTWHVEGRKLFIGQDDRQSVYSYFDANGNLVKQFTEYVTYDGTQPTAPSNEDTLTPSFTKATSAMAATWLETQHTYGLLNQRLTTVVDAIAGSGTTQYTTTYNYDDNYNQIRSITPLGIEHETVLDERELVYQRIAAEGETEEATFRSDFDANGNLWKSFDALGNQTTFLLDGFDRQIKVTDAGSHYRETDYDAASNATETRAYDNSGLTPVLLAQTQFTYDEINRAKQVRRLAKNRSGGNIGDGWSDSFTALDMNSRVRATKDDNGVIYTTTYDAANRVATSVDGAGNLVEYTYNSDGATTRVDYDDYNQITTGTESSHTESDLDLLNRVIRFRDQRYNVSTRDTEVAYEYDGLGRTVRTVDASGVSTLTFYDLLSRTTVQTRFPTLVSTPPYNPVSDTIETTYTYDADSRNLTRTIWANATTPSGPQTTEYQFDKRNRLKKLIRPDADEWTFTYNAQNRTGWTDPLGTSVADTFDNRNQLTQRDITRGTGVLGVTQENYQYDGLGRLKEGKNYEDNGGGNEMHTEIDWHYNTLSLPERVCQELHDGWGKEREFETDATYDGAGFNTSHTYASGRNVTYTPGANNRLTAINDVTHSVTNLATFSYAGSNRLIRRTYANGSITTIGYEAAGCGCGGFSASFVEGVKHEGGDSNLLFHEERLFDVNGNPTAARWEHLGGVGEVYRYDGTHRLTNVYEGVDMQGGALATYAGSTDPTVFSLVRNYGFDTRGNRTTVAMENSSSGAISTDTYTPDSLTNVYDQINGQTFEFDAAENQTYDPTTGLYKAYDYLGRLVAEAVSDTVSDPSKRYRYDVHSRLRVEETNYQASYHNAFTTFYESFPNDAGGSGSCGGNPGIIYAGETRVDENDDDMRLVEYTLGVGITGSMSGSATSPWLATQLPGGSNNGKNVVLAELVSVNGSVQSQRYRHENQQRSLLGMTNEFGDRRLEVDYGEYGLAHTRIILWDGSRQEYIDSVQQAESQTEIILSNGGNANQPVTADMLGALARFVSPGSSPYVLFGRVTTVATGSSGGFYVEDPTGAIYTMLTTGTEDYVTVFGHHDKTINSGEVHTAGLWSSDPSYSSGTTTFTVGTSVFPAHMTGWILQPDARYPVFYPITGGTGTTVTVAGDITATLPSPEEEDVYYFLIPPAGVDWTTGTLDLTPPGRTSRYLAFQYLYIPPVVGVWIEDEVVGAQPGTNLSGMHYAWNRFYQPETGRWLTPDPAASPWTGLITYSAAVLQAADPSGLVPFVTGINVKTLANPRFDSCGGFEVKYTFELKQPAPCEGYIVQKVTLSSFAKDCANTGVLNLHGAFWEAWPVRKGDKLHELQAKGHVDYTDRSAQRNRPRTYGFHFRLGEIRFYCKSTTGDLGTYNTPPSTGNSGWKPGKDQIGVVSLAQSLPSTDDPNNARFWNLPYPAGQTAARVLLIFWDCCNTGGWPAFMQFAAHSSPEDSWPDPSYDEVPNTDDGKQL